MLYQQARPTKLEGIIGNDATIRAIRALLRQKDQPHAILLKGPYGCGKTTIARILAKEFKCDEINIHEYNTVNTGIDTVREISDSANLSGIGGGNKVYILDEAHELTKKSQEDMLKILEDCPRHCLFILCTTSPQNLGKGIRNRCTEYEFGLLSSKEIVELLKRICEDNKFTVTDELLEAISYTCEGSPRAAIVSLEQVIGIEDVDEALGLLVKGTERDANVIEICKLLVMSPEIREKKWKRILEIFSLMKDDNELIRKSIITFVFNHLLRCEKIEDAKDLVRLLGIFSTSTFYGGRSQLGALIAKACFSAERTENERL